MDNLLIIALPLVGVVLGASLQHLFAKRKGKFDRSDSARDGAYADYLQSVATIANSQMGEDRDFDFKTRSALADAKSRIVIFGSDEVIACLAKFEKSGAVLSDPHSMDCFMNVLQTMRNEGRNGKTTAESKEMKLVVFGEK